MSTDLESLRRLAFEAVPVLLDAAAKSLLLLPVAGALVLAMRRASAAARQVVWLLALTALIALPVASAALPSWGILPGWVRIEIAESAERGEGLSPARDADILPAQTTVYPLREADRADTPAAVPQSTDYAPDGPLPDRAAPVEQAPLTGSEITPPVAVTGDPAAPDRTWRSWVIPSAVAAWLAGTLVCLLPLVLGQISLWRLARRSKLITGGSWGTLSRRAAQAVGLRLPVTLLQSGDEPMPMVWGTVRPKLLLPAEAEDWGVERRWVVLLHEMAHAKRRDCLAKLIAHVACSLYWFNPLCWIAFKLMQREAEAACDDLVLSSTTVSPADGDALQPVRPSDYAQHLLEIASGLKSSALAAYNSIAMARRSKLEGRLLAILDATRNRRALTRIGIVVATAIIAAIVIPLACMRAAQEDKPAGGATQPEDVIAWRDDESQQYVGMADAELVKRIGTAQEHANAEPGAEKFSDRDALLKDAPRGRPVGVVGHFYTKLRPGAVLVIRKRLWEAAVFDAYWAKPGEEGKAFYNAPPQGISQTASQPATLPASVREKFVGMWIWKPDGSRWQPQYYLMELRADGTWVDAEIWGTPSNPADVLVTASGRPWEALRIKPIMSQGFVKSDVYELRKYTGTNSYGGMAEVEIEADDKLAVHGAASIHWKTEYSKAGPNIQRALRAAMKSSAATRPAVTGAIERTLSCPKGFPSEKVSVGATAFFDLDKCGGPQFGTLHSLPDAAAIRKAGVDILCLEDARGGPELRTSGLDVQPLSTEKGWDSDLRAIRRSLELGSPFALTIGERRPVAFRTGDGATGILQIVHVDDKLAAFTIRYKILSDGATSQPATQPEDVIAWRDVESQQYVGMTDAELVKRIGTAQEHANAEPAEKFSDKDALLKDTPPGRPDGVVGHFYTKLRPGAVLVIRDRPWRGATVFDAYWAKPGEEGKAFYDPPLKGASRTTSRPATEPADDWGKANNGVQARLRADKHTWAVGQTPSFRAEIRNQGKGECSVAQAQQACELELDGTRYEWNGASSLKYSDLPPGREYRDIPVSPEITKWIMPRSDWGRVVGAAPMPLLLYGPGKHALRIRFFCDGGSSHKNLVVESNAVEFEIAAPGVRVSELTFEALSLQEKGRPVRIETNWSDKGSTDFSGSPPFLAWKNGRAVFTGIIDPRGLRDDSVVLVASADLLNTPMADIPAGKKVTIPRTAIVRIDEVVAATQPAATRPASQPVDELTRLSRAMLHLRMRIQVANFLRLDRPGERLSDPNDIDKVLADTATDRDVGTCRLATLRLMEWAGQEKVLTRLAELTRSDDSFVKLNACQVLALSGRRENLDPKQAYVRRPDAGAKASRLCA